MVVHQEGVVAESAYSNAKFYEHSQRLSMTDLALWFISLIAAHVAWIQSFPHRSCGQETPIHDAPTTSVDGLERYRCDLGSPVALLYWIQESRSREPAP